ncbi:MAG: PQQ-binding-like beta-propeller repeat protein, partial [Gammaproteobacteria bacterium]
MKSPNLKLLALALAAAGLVGSATAQEVSGGATTTFAQMAADVRVSQEMLAASEGDKSNWLQTNGGWSNARYAAGDQIHVKNVAKLRPAFIVQTEIKESMETAPVVVNGVMYITTSYNHIYAVDATTGKQFWHYKHKMGPVTTYCCGPNN